ncbi:MAG: SIR2 family protein [Gammaproteobacteria bacterium]|nr:SIR2 family protein [Gammaproteobacteria bacterium]
MKVPELREWISVPEEVVQAAKSGELVMFIGAGVSMRVNLPSWQEFAYLVLDNLTTKGLLNHNQLKLLKNLEPRKILSIARNIERETETNLDYVQYFNPKEFTSEIYKSLNLLQCTYVTTNYDLLLEPTVEYPERDRSGPKKIERITSPDNMLCSFLDQPGNVIHLHGAIEPPKTMVISTEEYLQLYAHVNVQKFLEYLFSRKTVVFVGYGLEETELLEHILRRGSAKPGSDERKLFALKGYYSHQEPIYQQLFKYYKTTFGLNQLGFLLDTKHFELLDDILKDWVKEIKVQPVPLSHHVNMLDEMLDASNEQSKDDKRDVLQRIQDRPELVPVFFQLVKGVEWFDALDEQTFFSVENNPKPENSEDDEYVLVPYWEILDYLEKTSVELKDPKNSDYAKKFLDLILRVTRFARDENFSNYRTWWKFTYIISNIPSKLVSHKDLELIDYWLDDPYDTHLVCELIGSQWVRSLLADTDECSHDLAIRLILLIFKVKLPDQYKSAFDPCSVQIRVDVHLGQRITNLICKPLGHTVGLKFLRTFDVQLKSILSHVGESSSHMWRPAIEEHKQNSRRLKPIDLIMDIFRDTLDAFIATNSEEAIDYMSQIFESDYTVIKRIAIHVINQNFRICRQFIDTLLDPSFWTPNFKHELWILINQHYSSFSKEQRESVLNVITQMKTEEESLDVEIVAYRQAEWLTAIKDFGPDEREFYSRCVETAQSEPKHPSFTNFIESGKVEPKSPISVAQLASMETSDLIEYLMNFGDEDESFFESKIEGLFQAFRQVIKSSPLSFSQKLDSFDKLDLRYVYQIIEAFREIWGEEKSLRWTEIWNYLLSFCQRLVSEKEFWKEIDYSGWDPRIPNRNWVVGSIAKLIEAGARDDENFDHQFVDKSQGIVVTLLQHQEPETLDINDDSYFDAINSTRGKCVHALINLTLRKCREADKTNNKDHSSAWKQDEYLFNQELELRSTRSYEVPSLFAGCLPQFMYMSSDWTLGILDDLFSSTDPKWWRCAMEGYAYVSSVYDGIYTHLKDNGHLIHALDEEYVYDPAKDRVIEHICVAYCYDIESLDDEDSLISVLISRNIEDEMNQAIVNLWRLANENVHISDKLSGFWKRVTDNLDLETKGSQAIASQLCMLAEFVSVIDDSNRELIHSVVPYVHVEFNTDRLFRWLNKISENQPLEALYIWKLTLRYSLPTYPEESMKNILKNIWKVKNVGKSSATEISDMYIEQGNDMLRKWLSELL